MVHNEFHGEQSHNQSYCSYSTKTADGACILWSTDLAGTSDGGTSWTLTRAPVLTLPREYIKDSAKAGYGALGSVLFESGYYYGHVAREYHGGTGGGPPGKSDSGICVWRSRDPNAPGSFEGWNGSAWSARWLNPYEQSKPVPPDDLWRYTCASIEVGGRGSHANPKRFAGAWRPAEWPSHVLLNWPGEDKAVVSYAFPDVTGAAGGIEPFTAWGTAQELDLSGWFDPHEPAICSGRDFMYPALIDHDSPFTLAEGDDVETAADGLSYGLIGNRSLHIYFVCQRRYVMRVPVAWFPADAPTPPPPFPPLPPIPTDVPAIRVEGAGLPGVDGVYVRQPACADGVGMLECGASSAIFSRDPTHQIYCLESRWRIAHHGAQSLWLPSHPVCLSTRAAVGPPAHLLVCKR